jgi:hypothetical protein
LQLFGGDLAASNYMTPFGGSQGLLWDWSGPNAFTSTIQNPTTDTAWGTYQLIVTEKRNGCKDTAQQALSYLDFATLVAVNLHLSGAFNGNSVLLNWQDKDQANAVSYSIERSVDGIHFNEIGTVTNTENGIIVPSFSFEDHYPVSGNNFYRIKSTAKNGRLSYSNILPLNASGLNDRKSYLAASADGTAAWVHFYSEKETKANLVVYNSAGQAILKRNVELHEGANTIDLGVADILHHSMAVVCVFENNQLVFAQKGVL